MATSLAIIILFGLLSKKLFDKFKLPGLLGMIIVGILIGPFGLNLLSDEILIASADFRKIALIVILLRAGLGIKKEDIKKVGRPAINMSFIPGMLEGFIIIYIHEIIRFYIYTRWNIRIYNSSCISSCNSYYNNRTSWCNSY